MRVISNRSLREFSRRHPEAGLPLQGWRKLMQHGSPCNFADGLDRFTSISSRYKG